MKEFLPEHVTVFSFIPTETRVWNDFHLIMQTQKNMHPRQSIIATPNEAVCLSMLNVMPYAEKRTTGKERLEGPPILPMVVLNVAGTS
jgi:hypothetical protein